MNDDDKVDLLENGVDIFMFCGELEEIVETTLEFSLMFLGGFTSHPKWPKPLSSHISTYMEKYSKEFLKVGMHWDLEPR